MKPYSFSTDKALAIAECGTGIAELTGSSAEETVGKKYYEVFPRMFLGDTDAVSLAIHKSRSIDIRGYIFNCAQDRTSHMWADLRIDPLRDGRAVRGAQVTFSNVSLCPVVKALHDSLHSSDMGKVVSTIAHGMRNSLNALKGAIVYIQERYAAEKTLMEFSKIMEEEVGKLSVFISRFLSAPVRDMNPALTDINALLKRVGLLSGMQCRASNIRYVSRYGDIPPVMVDPFLIEQAIINVVNNAFEAMQSGGVLQVKTRKMGSAKKPLVVVEISDTGPGIAARGNNLPCVNQSCKGRGFGLPITREILERHGGKLEIRCKAGAGTTVRLCIPAEGGK